MSEIKHSRRINFTEAVDLILNSGLNSVHLTGEPGVGKTAIQDVIVERTGYHKVYIDGPNTDVGQAGMPIPNHTTRTLDFYPAESFKLHTGEPCVIMIDEWTKTDDYVRNTLHPLLHERRMGNFYLHPDSIVFTTGNDDSDGVGDSPLTRELEPLQLAAAGVGDPVAERSADDQLGADLLVREVLQERRAVDRDAAIVREPLGTEFVDLDLLRFVLHVVPVRQPKGCQRERPETAGLATLGIGTVEIEVVRRPPLQRRLRRRVGIVAHELVGADLRRWREAARKARLRGIGDVGGVTAVAGRAAEDHRAGALVACRDRTADGVVLVDVARFADQRQCVCEVPLEFEIERLMIDQTPDERRSAQPVDIIHVLGDIGAR